MRVIKSLAVMSNLSKRACFAFPTHAQALKHPGIENCDWIEDQSPEAREIHHELNYAINKRHSWDEEKGRKRAS